MFQVGDHVTPDASSPRVPLRTVGVVYRVTAVPGGSRKKVAAVPVSPPGARGINFPPELLLPAANGEADRQKFVVATPLQRRIVGPPLVEGSIVTIKKAWRDYRTDEALVVLRNTSAGRVSLGRLGGDDHRAFTCPTGWVVQRDLNWLAEHLLEGATR